MSVRFITPKAAFILALSIACLPAHAQTVTEEDDSIRASVSTAGLDLAVPGDQARLHHRIARSAALVCRVLMDEPGGAGNAFTDCSRATRDQAWSAARQIIAAAEGRARLASANR